MPMANAESWRAKRRAGLPRSKGNASLRRPTVPGRDSDGACIGPRGNSNIKARAAIAQESIEAPIAALIEAQKGGAGNG